MICSWELEKEPWKNTSPVSDFGFFFMSLTYKRFVFYVVLAMALAGVEWYGSCPWDRASRQGPAWVLMAALSIRLVGIIMYIFYKELFILCIWVCCSCLQTRQKRASDPIIDGCEPPCRCWELNSEPLEELSVLFHWAISRVPLIHIFKTTVFVGWCCCFLRQ